jgi:16S rRNA (guanine527-N7)-methyltransferase
MNKVSQILSAILPFELNDGVLSRFEELARHVAEENEKINITSITDPVGVATKHFADSLSLLTLPLFSKTGARVADIGCGGGFPGIPIALARPDLRLVMVDSTEKKIRYVERTAEKFGIEKMKCVAGRAEALAAPRAQLREKFDIVTSRAVARLSVLSEICLPFVATGGYFVAMKAAEASSELDEARRGIGILGGKVEEVVEVRLSADALDRSAFDSEELQTLDDFLEARRALIVIKKVRPTPSAYPRAWAQITKKVL